MIKKSMFESIKGSLLAKKNNNTYADILRMEVGGTYKVRLLPNKTDPSQSILEYVQFGWNSLATNEYMAYVSPLSFDRTSRDPIHELRVKLYRGSAEEQELAKKIRKLTKYMVNVYVEEDSSNPENVGTVKVLRYGTQLHNIIEAATVGDDSDEYGVERVFSLDEDGCSLQIRVTEQGGYANYTTSKFTLPHPVDGMTEKKVEQVIDSTYDLASLLTIKSYEELQEVAKVHILCEGSLTTAPSVSHSSTTEAKKKEEPKENKEDPPSMDDVDGFGDVDIDELLEGLDD